MENYNKNNIKHKITDIVETKIINNDFYNDNSISMFDKDIIQYADFDSLAYVEMFMELEKTFDISLDNDDIVNFLDNERNITINKITNFVFEYGKRF